MKCPYCAEEIQQEAAKCRHCGEWLDPSKRPPSSIGQIPKAKADYSKYQLYTFRIRDSRGKFMPRRILANSEEEAIKVIPKHLKPGEIYDEKHGLAKAVKGRFSCPNCGSPFTYCRRAIGCAVLIIIFVSLGLGLLLIPLLPFECECLACHYSWRE